MKQNHLKHTKRHAGFTLVELLVVVAIIAVIGAGVAVTYRYLDEQAKTSMEISDCSIIKKAISQWSAINDNNIPNGLDSLVTDNDDLYSTMPVVSGMGGVTESADISMGVEGPLGYTVSVKKAPQVVLDNLASAGLTTLYRHLTGAANTNGNANDSTWTAGTISMGPASMSSGAVDTSKTLSTLNSSSYAADVKAAQEMVDDTGPADGWDDATVQRDGYTAPDGKTYMTESEFVAAQTEAQKIVDAQTLDHLAFLWGTSGATMQGQPMPMNMANEIITNCGYAPDEIADPTVEDVATEIANGKKCYLVVFGLGRFASIYNAKSIRIDAPAYGKRNDQSKSVYNRYLVVVSVPLETYSDMTGATQKAQVVDVLTPQGYSVASLRDKYITDGERVKD